MSLVGLMAGLALAGQQGPPLATTPVDPAAWWSPEISRPPPEADPLYGRRLGRHETPTPFDNGVDPLLYRLWGLQPLQTQLVRRGEFILEVWARPARGVRQAVIRIAVRRDGRAFVQARAGLGCCEPQIARRVDIDSELTADQIAALKAVTAEPAWSQPRDVSLDYGDGSVSPVCLDGVAWDVTLLIPGQARHLRRACDDAEVGSIARVLGPALSAAIRRDPRFDAMFARGADMSRQQAAYDQLIASGGRLRPAADGRTQPPAVPVPPEADMPAQTDQPEPASSPVSPPSGY